MWTLKSILLAKLLNAGMNEWLLAPVQLVQLCSASLGVEYFLSQTGAQSTALNQQGNKSTDHFSRGHLFLLKYQASFHETPQYDHFLLLHNKYQAITPNVVKLQNPCRCKHHQHWPMTSTVFPLLLQYSFLHHFIITFLFSNPASPHHVRNFILTSLNPPEAACNCPEPKCRNKCECRSNSTEILQAPVKITGHRHPCVF